MQIREEQQLNPVADEVGAITAVVRPILTGLVYGLKADVAASEGGYDKVPLWKLPRLYRPGDGDAGICFEYAVHDALNNQHASVVERVGDALAMCKVNGDVSSILFGVEKAGSQQLIETAAATLTNESRLMSGTRGQPVKLKKHLYSVAAAFRSKPARLALPYSINGLWKADLFLGSTGPDRWVGTTVKSNLRDLQGARGLRVGIVPASEGKSDSVRVDDSRNLVICPLPYDGDFVETFYSGWAVVQQFLAADAQLPAEIALTRPAQRQVARYLVERRTGNALEVVEVLGPLAQPQLLRTEEQSAAVTFSGGKSETIEVANVVVPQPSGLTTVDPR